MIISTFLAVALAQQPTTEARLMRYPNIHGDRIVFTYASDLWVCDIKDGLARRLTSHPNAETRAKFSPDGKWIAFTGQYDGPPNVYVVSAD